MSSDISKRIYDGYSTFSKGHKRIADAVLHEYDKVAYMTAKKLGLFVNVSESTVVRFCFVLGYEGYSEFQRAMQELVRKKLTPNQRISITRERIGNIDVLESVMESDITKIRRTLSSVDRNTFQQSVNSILAARRIFVMGARSSEALAMLLNYNLSLMFDNVKFIRPSSSAEVFEQIFSICRGDLMIAFSFPRYSTKIINAVKFAKQKGADVIVVTDTPSSPLVEYATHALFAQSDMASFSDSLVAPISIINALIIEITNRSGNRITERFDRLEKIWDEYNVYSKK